MFGLAAIPSLIQFVGFMFMPESPRWLISKGQESKAQHLLQKLRPIDQVQQEINDIKLSCQQAQAHAGQIIYMCSIEAFFPY